MGFHDFLIAEGERKTAQNSSVVFSLVHGVVRGPPRSFWHPHLYIEGAASDTCSTVCVLPSECRKDHVCLTLRESARASRNSSQPMSINEVVGR